MTVSTHGVGGGYTAIILICVEWQFSVGPPYLPPNLPPNPPSDLPSTVVFSLVMTGLQFSGYLVEGVGIQGEGRGRGGRGKRHKRGGEVRGPALYLSSALARGYTMDERQLAQVHYSEVCNRQTL